VTAPSLESPALPSARFAAWRAKARSLLAVGVAPHDASWDSADLLGPAAAAPSSLESPLRFTASLLDLFERAFCHRDPRTPALLYRLVWRIAREGRGLVHDLADDDVALVTRRARAVDHAEHRMHAFVRFRELHDSDGLRYVARFEPEHDVLERAAAFFVARYASMDWTIVTPELGVRWDRTELRFFAVDAQMPVPAADAAESLWLTYFGSIFNPARMNLTLMRSEMPLRYWKHLLEAQRVPELVAHAMPRAGQMLANPQPHCAQRPAFARARPTRGDVDSLDATLQTCRRCPLGERATQAVPGEGPGRARLMLIGEQPGDEEDLVGKPFVGPAGKVLRRALAEAGIDAAEVYVTNAVKHFSYEPRGKRRIHKTPAQREVDACRAWLADELASVQPGIIVTLGATALYGVLTQRLAIGAARERTLWHNGARLVATYHPSSVLRAQDRDAANARYAAIVDDLRAAAALLDDRIDAIG
jgi:uracil-DNA glycosylase